MCNYIVLVMSSGRLSARETPGNSARSEICDNVFFILAAQVYSTMHGSLYGPGIASVD
jgi:hypothetical protein